MRYLLDTNAVIALLKSSTSPIAVQARKHDPREIVLSSIVTHELYFGAFKSRFPEANRARLDALRFEVLPFDKEDSIAAGKVRADLGMSGTPIGPFDVLIAGQALCRGLTLVTANTREFVQVQGLTVEDWSTVA
jgi:tRNA(fMet)-specific endonuclease VapC